MAAPSRRLIDIAANLSDSSFTAGKAAGDLPFVLQRAKSVGVQKFLLAGGSLSESQKAFETSLTDVDCFCTLGVHPCRANEVDRASYFDEMRALVPLFGKKLVAIGECGLDYDRFNYSSKAQQLAAFPAHFDLAESTGLPLYLHSRNTGGDFNRILRQNRDRFTAGVVHSFTGEQEEMQELLDMGLYIGVNGCSLKTEANLEVVKRVPLDRIMLETDCPYCEIRKSHAGFRFVKTQFAASKAPVPAKPLRGRNEPMFIVQVLEAVAALLGVSEDELAEVSFQNSARMFGFQ